MGPGPSPPPRRDRRGARTHSARLDSPRPLLRPRTHAEATPASSRPRPASRPANSRAASSRAEFARSHQVPAKHRAPARAPTAPPAIRGVWRRAWLANRQFRTGPRSWPSQYSRQSTAEVARCGQSTLGSDLRFHGEPSGITSAAPREAKHPRGVPAGVHQQSRSLPVASTAISPRPSLAVSDPGVRSTVASG